MKHLFTFILAVFCINIGIAQVTDSFTTQQSDYNFTNDGIYDIITGDGNMFTEQIGAPQLPVFTQKYLLPEGSILTDISFATTKNQLTDTYYIYPSQPPCALNGEDCPDFVEPDPTIYNATTPFPANTVEVVNDNHTFGYHVISLKICPFEYIPANRILSIYTQINITINYTIGDIEYTTTISEYRHNLARDFVKSIVDNPNAISNITKTAYFVLPPPAVTDKLVFHYKPYDYVLYGGNIPDYIIITNEVLKPQFETFATYKTKKGIPTLVVTVEQIYQNYSGCDNAEKIRNYLKEAHLYWGDALFVLLGGDTVIIPERIGTEENIYNNGTYTYYYITTDMYYCDVYKFGEPNYNWNSDGDTDFGWDTPIELGPDNFIGRAPVDTTSEAQNFIDKIISYENLTNVTDTDYVNNLLFLGAYGKYPPESHVDLGQQWHDLIYYQSFFDDVPYVNKWRVFDDYLSSIPNTYVGDEELNKVTTIDRLNNGHPINNKHFHLVSHIDHGGAYSIGVSGLMKNNHLNRTDMDNLSNGSYYQIMYTGSCEPGEFEKDCIAEHYVNAPNGGGVAMLANSGFGWFGSQYQPVNLFESLYSNNITNGHIMGVASEKTKYFTTNQNKIKNLVLFGEPTMGVWTATPQNITLTVPTSITIDNNIDNELTVNINVLDEEATVALYKYNNTTNEIEIYAEQTISVGDTTATFIIHPDTEGDVFVKVTAKNYLPVTDAVNIIMPQAHLYVTDTSYDDANSNGYIEQGESITLDIQLTNSGNTNISGISATLSAFNPSLVNITQNQVAYSSIFAGNSAQLTGFSFDVLVTEETPPFIEFIVDIIGSGGFSHSDTFYLDLLNAKLELSNRITTDSDGELINDFVINENVFLDVFLKNTGAINQTGISATLTSSLVGDGIIEITTSDSNYPEIDVNEKFKNETSYVFKLLQTHTGAMPFTLTVQNSFGKTWLYDFDLREALPPLIEGFDFTSSKDEITIMWDPVSNIKGYNIYRSDTENGIYNQINDFLVVGSSLYDDLNLDELTEYYYKIAAVTLSGNELPKSQLITTPDYDDIPHNGYLAWTSLNTHNGFPAGADEVSSVNTCVTVEDINNDGTKELFPALRKGGVGVIMGYKESGEELFDIDGNATTNTGFARISRQDIGEDTSLWTKVAVGDIDNDGQAEVFATTDGVSPSVGYLYGYSTIDEDEDGKPDLLWTEPKSLGYRSFGPPVLANIDNDENHTLEIVTCTAGNSVKVFDTDGTVLWYKDLGSTFGPGTVLVADLDGNGTKEIIYGTQNNPGSVMGLYIWDFEGNDFGNTNPIYSSNDMRFSASPIAGDIDNDGELEIIIVGRKLNIHKLYAFNPDGSFVTGKWDGQIDLDLPSLNNNMCCEIANTPQPAIGDLDDDGFLEVVYADETKVTVYDNNGDLTLTIPIDQLKAGYHMSPILADIDDDPAIEIIIKASNDRIYAFNPDGTECIGWRLRSGTTSGFVGSPSIADLDNDGLNELIISDAECVTHVWKTTGDANKVEWGSYRFNAQNTGAYENFCKFSETATIEITDVGEVWNTTKDLQGNLIIKSGADLTIHAKVTFLEEATIIVEPNAKLILDGVHAVLTNSCDTSWQGIQVLGNKNLPQTQANQGVIEIINGGTIENAKTAIYVGNQDLANDTQTGGIVRIEDAVFINNRYGVYFANYRTSENQSYIKNSIFKITEEYPQYPYNSSPRAAVYLWDVGNIAIEGNTFINESDLASSFGGKRGIGVKAVDADFSLVPSTTAPNQFINLYQGVVVENTADNSSCTIDSNSFTGNLNAIYLNNTNSVKITSNIIDLGIDYTFDNKISGIYLKGSNYFQIEANEIINTLTTSHNETVGIYINECNNVNEIYRNEFSDINTGVFSDGINAGDANGLQIIYNIFNDVENDIYVAPESQIAPNQGSIRETAGNQFIPECSGSFNEFYNNGNQISYYKEDVPKYIPDCNYQVNLFTGLVANECASKLEKPTDYEDKMLLADNDINQRQTDLEVLTDGGDTQTLNETVDEAENNEALSLRNELLSKSPTLSDTVMVNTTSIESVLPSLMVKQVLAANPKAAKSSVVQTALDERQNPLPEYMRAEIDLGKDTLSYKEELESRLSSAINARENLIDRKILHLKQEGSFESLDTLKTILLAEASTKLNRSYQLVDYYLSQDNAQEAQVLFTALPTNFNLSSSQQNKYNKLNQLYSIRFNLENADKSWFEMSASQKGVIETLAIDSTSTAGMQSRAVLSLVDAIDYGIYIPDVDTSNYQTNSYNGAPEMLFKAYPQVATDYFIIEYILGENENPEEVTIAVFDDKGKQLKSFEVLNHANQFLIECENWQEGVYWCRKSVGKRVTEQKKVIINKGGIVIDSVEASSVKGTNSLVLFPNPTSGYLFVSFNLSSDTMTQSHRITITDTKGTLIAEYQLKNNLTQIATDKWQQGVYIVSIIANNKVVDTAKIIVE